MIVTGKHRDITEYYPGDIDEGKKVEVITIFNEDGKLKRYPKMMATRGTVVTDRGGVFDGYKYWFPEDTFGGLCMATMIGHAKGCPFIAFHHLAGRKQKGAGGALPRKVLLATIERLGKKPHVLISHSAAPMETKSMDIEFGPLTRPHDKCPTHTLPLDAKIRVHGGHNGAGS